MLSKTAMGIDSVLDNIYLLHYVEKKERLRSR
jgi:hypothetical protein